MPRSEHLLNMRSKLALLCKSVSPVEFRQHFAAVVALVRRARTVHARAKESARPLALHHFLSSCRLVVGLAWRLARGARNRTKTCQAGSTYNRLGAWLHASREGGHDFVGSLIGEGTPLHLGKDLSGSGAPDWTQLIAS